MIARPLITLALTAALGACRATSAPPPAAPEGQPEFTTLAPGLRADASAGVVEFDGFVAEDVHHPDTPRVYLEVIVCSRGTREHEALVVTDVAPSLVHAALLAAGLEPGAPGGVSLTADGDIARTAPTGDAARVTFRVSDQDQPIDPRVWAVHADTGAPLAAGDASFVFAGSVMRERSGRAWYAADAEGTLVGLATFGTETVALTDAISHASAIDEPAWIADRSRVPDKGTPVVVRIERAE
ncbi:MAG: YdjY domain-containing protein [Phycisphaerales bacterium]